MALIQILPTTVKERQFPSFLACLYNSIPSPKKHCLLQPSFLRCELDLALNFRPWKNNPVIFQAKTGILFAITILSTGSSKKSWIPPVGTYFLCHTCTDQTHFQLISLIASISLIACTSIVSIKSASVLFYCTLYRYFFPYTSHKGKQNYSCHPEFTESGTAACSRGCSFGLGRAPVLSPKDEPLYM